MPPDFEPTLDGAETAAAVSHVAHTPVDPTPAPAPSSDFLFPLAEVSGYSILKPRDRKFCEGILSGLSQTEAARQAGVTGDVDVIRATASKMVRRGNVSAFLNQAMAKAGATPDRNLARVEQAAVMWDGVSRDESKPMKERRAAAKLAHSYATLLASIHGKLSLNVNSTVRADLVITVSEDQRSKISSLLAGYRQMKGGCHAQN